MHVKRPGRHGVQIRIASICNDAVFYFTVDHLTTMPVLRLSSLDDRMINERDAVSRLKVGRGSQSSWRNHELVPLCPPHIPYDLIRDQL